jgi:DNA adenine methylase
MAQLSLGSDDLTRIVNVASVPRRSPFRYPGGKTWLVPRLRQWLHSLPEKPHEFIEPFAGGGIISLTVGFEQLAERVTMVELDDEVAAVWQTVLNGRGEWLAQHLERFELTPESLETELARSDLLPHERGFRTLLRNRVNHGGILAPGSGALKNGESGRGIRSRWYPQTLKKRVLAIVAIRERFTFIHGDGMEVLRRNADRADAVTFIDPPYTAAGKKAGARLYTHFELDHEELFRIAKTLKGDFLMTYDNADGVRALAERHGFDTQPIPMKNTHHAEMSELLIGRSLDWAR